MTCPQERSSRILCQHGGVALSPSLSLSASRSRTQKKLVREPTARSRGRHCYQRKILLVLTSTHAAVTKLMSCRRRLFPSHSSTWFVLCGHKAVVSPRAATECRVTKRNAVVDLLQMHPQSHAQSKTTSSTLATCATAVLPTGEKKMPAAACSAFVCRSVRCWLLFCISGSHLLGLGFAQAGTIITWRCGLQSSRSEQIK